jgi:methionyl-tRNA formyltransferase
MKVVVFGINVRACEVLDFLLDKGIDVVGLVTEQDCRTVISRFQKKIKNIFTPRDINTASASKNLRELNADVFLIISYNQILNKRILEIPRLGTYNCHGGPLPGYRGSSVLNWQIINGEKNIGLSMIKINEGIDEGDIVLEAGFPISGDATIVTVTDQSIELFKSLTIQLLELLKSNRLKFEKQRRDKAVYWHKRHPEDGKIDWQNMTALQIHNLIRALTPPCSPGAFTFFNKKKVILVDSRLPEAEMRSGPGKVSRKFQGKILVGAKDFSSLLIDKIVVDEKILDAADYFKKFPSYLGD